MMWWIKDPKRLADERQAIAAIDEDWFENPAWSLDTQGRLRLLFDIALPHRRFRLEMTYHNTFPASPPSIRPIDDPERISSHQYGPGGELCLSIRSDNWNPDITGADMIHSAYTLLDLETPDEDGEVLPAPSAHQVSHDQLLRYATARFYVDHVSRLALASDDLDGAPIEVGLDFRFRPCSLARLLSIGPHPPDGVPIPVGAPCALRDTSLVYAGNFYILDVPTAAVKAIKTVEELRTIVGENFTLPTQPIWVCVVRTSDQDILLLRHISGSEEVFIYQTINGPHDPRARDTTVQFSPKKGSG